MADAILIPVEAKAALLLARRTFTQPLVGVYLHGSAVEGGLKPHSDVDVLVVIEEPVAKTLRKELICELMKISGRPRTKDKARPLELIVIQRADLAAMLYPARCEVIYGEWLRDSFESGEVPEASSDPELTLVLAQARPCAIPLQGPPLDKLYSPIPHGDIRRGIRDTLPALIETLTGDERNVLLTLSRMWRTLTTEEFVSKDNAALWATARLPAQLATILEDARLEYLGSAEIDWRPRHRETQAAVGYLEGRVKSLLSLPSGRPD